jgi:predicted nucleic acid-binding protein
MADVLVVDASVALGIVLREPGAQAARIRLVESAGRLLVPDHFWLEITNVLVRRYGRSVERVVSALRDLDELGLETVSPDRPAVLLGLDLMARHGLTAYDAAYLALAEIEDGALLTLDVRLAAAAGPRAALGPSRTGEALESYASRSVTPGLAAHGRYLAELRQAAAQA